MKETPGRWQNKGRKSANWCRTG